MPDRVTILSGVNTGKSATVLGTQPDGKLWVLVDGHNNYMGLRAYGPSSVKVETAAPAPTSPPPAPTPTVVTASPSGVAMPTTEPDGWRRIFEDDFNTPVALGRFPADASKWDAYPVGWRDTSKHGVYDPERVLSVHDGVLDYHCRTEGGTPLVAAPFPRLPTPAVAYQLYGLTFYALDACRITVRRRCDAMLGYKTAWLLWPKSEVWPRDGEIDFPEGDLKPGGSVSAFMHRQGATDGGDQDWFGAGAFDTSWHTYVIEWRKGQSCRFEVDGRSSQTFTSRVPSTAMRYVMQTETELLPAPVPAASVQGHVLVDWITVAVAT